MRTPLVRSLSRVFPAGRVVGAAALLAAARLGAQTNAPLHAGPLFDEFNLTLTPGHRVEAVGPFYYREQTESQHTWALPPFLTVTRDPEVESKEVSFIYPVMSYVRYGQQYRWQFGQILSFAGGPSQTETNRDRFTLFPFYFQQRSSDTNENYTAYGPFYGHLKNRLFRDEITYVMFPAYSRTRKGDKITENYLFPFVDVRHGPGLEGWQFWPFYGQEHKEITTRTNGFQEVETVPGHDKHFVLWPMYFNDHSGIGSENPEWQQGVIPFYSFLRSPQRQSTTVIWPFFSRIEDRQKKYREWEAPWPLVEFARGEGKHTSRVWPFYSHSYNTNQVSNFYFWPIYKYNRILADPLDRQRTRIVFFLYNNVSEKNSQSGDYRQRVQLWPFFSWRRDLNGNQRLQVLAIMEPFFQENPRVEREYAQVYSLWRTEHNARNGASSRSLLWNLYRRDATPATSHTSAFFGLVQCDRDASGRHFRFFHPRSASVKKTDAVSNSAVPTAQPKK